MLAAWNNASVPLVRRFLDVTSITPDQESISFARKQLGLARDFRPWESRGIIYQFFCERAGVGLECDMVITSTSSDEETSDTDSAEENDTDGRTEIVELLWCPSTEVAMELLV